MTIEAYSGVTDMQTFRLPIELIARLDAAKADSRLTKTTILRDALEKHLPSILGDRDTVH
jgi:predicted DNA-binding protein